MLTYRCLRPFILAVLVHAALVLTAGCVLDRPPPEADQLALARVQRKVESRLVLGLEHELYVTARIRPGASVTQADMEQVYRDFFFLPDGSRRDTDYVYLNVYDADGRFQYQLAYVPRTGRMVRNASEHY